MEANEMWHDNRTKQTTCSGKTIYEPEVGQELKVVTPMGTAIGTVIGFEEEAPGFYTVEVDLETPAAAVERLIRELSR